MTMSRRLGWVVPVRRLKQTFLAALALVLALVYVWVAAVRAVPGVRRRKAAARKREAP